MRIITANLNGIRAAANKGFFQWMPTQQADIVCVQELKAQPDDMTSEMKVPDGYHGYFHCADKKGYSGVGLYSRHEPDKIIEGVGIPEIDSEGRYLRADFGDLSIISIYLPSGSSGEHRQAIKFFFMERFFPILQALAHSGREIILCGDWNIAHKEIDLKNWRANQKHSGFLPEERAWLTTVFEELKFIDVFRKIDQSPEQYTWWSNRGQAWAKNVGWRIDYQIATPSIADKATSVSIYKQERFSDHAPLIIDYDHHL
ncbi:exodeoxyribonuclease III [Nitrosomonas sp. Nm58]|jgi:exodeoxyribonuclease-3|uniref:exodeoxyribonuclease III n=1 Tax=Nitrosomonas sp. Nm58 TaxID=200126 RepID=UPI000896870B|nr:exodeoxyribonuclease III [Nitrosomonas sp. Nm58]SDY74990.1 exodeoxyribonuclease-3 [Nitrosomonas sp. Nm58]